MKQSQKIGKVFGCMQVIEARTITVNGKENSQYRVRCVNCGTERWHATSVLRGNAKCYNCNPLERPPVPKGARKNTPKGLYGSYRSMVRRCTKQNCDQWPYYGGRGIKVCNEWLYDYYAFVEWAMENGWAEGKTIDRIDSDGNYEPSNCRWADAKTQMNNRSFNIHLEYQGESLTLAQFCEKTGANYDRARYLIFRKGLTVEEALRQMELNN